MLNIHGDFFRKVMPEIGPEATAVLLAISKYIGKEKTSFPEKKTIQWVTKMGRDRVNKGMNTLVAHGYLEKRQRIVEGGKFSSNIYKIKCKYIIPFNGEEKNELPLTEYPSTVIPSTVIPSTAEPLTENTSTKYCNTQVLKSISIGKDEVLKINKGKKAKAFAPKKSKSNRSRDSQKEKKVALKKRKDTTLEGMKVIFEKRWQGVIGEAISFSFTQKESRQLSNLKNKIIKQTGKEFTENELLEQFDFFLREVIQLDDKFYLRNFTPSILSSKFNEIITHIKLSKNGTSKKKGHQFNESKTAIGEKLFGKNI